MANQIATFFHSYPPEEARAGIADHIQSFWSRVMREGLQVRVAAGGHGLDPLVVQALGGAPQGESPIERETARPEEVGQLGSDAG
ncbi:formate dehydrogenase subunit delta [Roseomonas xinghualingensis]|uniref:formate dehydrogenase subunit delta n=1 Tax=Roseomonas xinghualingensis TaxID=2986475 RepID=UPI0021F1B4F4|nr:formate dehydrogenase subunit delta [Roseomonas sp. SXEYE001]MCV4207085.1 formate dehydrogenase subunit delta [Roseomonas sp. SXEYE001]